MSPIRLRFSLVASLLLLGAYQGSALSQAQRATQAPELEVRRLAPQLIGFAGTEGNFQNLVNGLALGNTVTLVTVTPDGLLQTATFTPAGTMVPLDIARSLEQARQNLISRGISAPTAEQIGVTLLGGSLATPLGNVPVAGVLGNVPAVPAASGSASTGSSTPTTAGTLSSNGLTVNTQQIPRASTGPSGTALPANTIATPTSSGAPTSATPRIRNTSDSPFLSNTSDTPVPPAAAGPNGPPSPAAQIQNRR